MLFLWCVPRGCCERDAGISLIYVSMICAPQAAETDARLARAAAAAEARHARQLIEELKAKHAADLQAEADKLEARCVR